MNNIILQNINTILSYSLTQRIIYTVGLLFWTLIFWRQITEHPFSQSSLNISYLTLYLVPAVILTLQIIFNNKILWGLIFGLFSGFVLYSIVYFLWYAFQASDSPNFNMSFWEFCFVLIYFSILLLVDLLIFSLKPYKIVR